MVNSKAATTGRTADQVVTFGGGLTCEVCGISIEQTPLHWKKFCSGTCRARAYRARVRGERPAPPARHCRSCGAVFGPERAGKSLVCATRACQSKRFTELQRERRALKRLVVIDQLDIPGAPTPMLSTLTGHSPP